MKRSRIMLIIAGLLVAIAAVALYRNFAGSGGVSLRLPGGAISFEPLPAFPLSAADALGKEDLLILNDPHLKALTVPAGVPVTVTLEKRTNPFAALP